MNLGRWIFCIKCALICGMVLPSAVLANEEAPTRFIVDAELPFRCAAPNEDKPVISTVVLQDSDFVFLSADGGDALPRYEVTQYNFKEKPTDVVISDLVKELQINVQAEVGSYPEMSGTQLHGELSSVIQQLTEKAGVFYTYHASTKTLFLTRRTNMLINVPHEKIVLMAVLDALRGAEMKRIDVDWEKYQIRLNVYMDELEKAKTLLAQILRDSYLLLAEAKMYYVDIRQYPHYLPQALDALGMQKVAMLKPGVIGQSVTFDKGVSADDFIAKVRQKTKIQLLARGVLAVPNGWKMRFNLGECSVSSLPYQSFALLMRTRILHPEELRTQFTLVTEDGELATFPLITSLNQEVVLGNIPAGKTGEFVFTVRLNLIRFAKKTDNIEPTETVSSKPSENNI